MKMVFILIYINKNVYNVILNVFYVKIQLQIANNVPKAINLMEIPVIPHAQKEHFLKNNQMEKKYAIIVQ